MPNVNLLLCPEWIATAEPLANDPTRTEVLTDHAVALDDAGTIAAVIPCQAAFDLFPGATRVIRPGELLTPGFVNLHTHGQRIFIEDTQITLLINGKKPIWKFIYYHIHF